MRKIKEVLRLHHDIHLSERAINRSINLSRDTVSRILTRFGEVAYHLIETARYYSDLNGRFYDFNPARAVHAT